MAETMEGEGDSGSLEKSDSVFVWDEKSQLFFHARSGFYHDPNAGWYYSSRDGLYYKFEDGNYVFLDSNSSKKNQGGGDNDDNRDINSSSQTAPENPVLEGDPCAHLCSSNNNEDKCHSFHANQVEDHQQKIIMQDKIALESTDCSNVSACESLPPPPSQWLEDTLIDLYLSGYSIPEVIAENAETRPMETETGDYSRPTDDCAETCDTYELEEGEWIPEDDFGVTNTGSPLDGDMSSENPGISWEEENWHAQYGQVTESGVGLVADFTVVDLWDWEMVSRCRKDRKGKVARLIGRLLKRSAKLHPSVPAGGGILKSAPICEVLLDLVRVKTGQVYRLRTPSRRYLASLTTYDSSNPTKDWNFPELSLDRKMHPPISSRSTDSNIEDDACEHFSSSSSQHSCLLYRDRAAERRILHGGYGVGPGQKKSSGVTDDDMPSSPASSEAATETLNMSFGTSTYARKILESMGWKEGEGLGDTRKGIVDPIQAVGNIGNTGLGWPQPSTRKKNHQLWK